MKKATPTNMESRSSFSEYNTFNQNFKEVTADQIQLEIFFKVLFKNAQEGHISLRGFKKNISAFKAEGYVLNDPKLVASAVRLSNIASKETNVVFCTPTATFKTPDSATGDQIENGIAISIDLDDVNPQKSKELLESILGPATLIVASGGKWTDDLTGEIKSKLHLHWRLKNPTNKREDHERLKEVAKKSSTNFGEIFQQAMQHIQCGCQEVSYKMRTLHMSYH